jgi:uncharacterized protein YegL
VSDAIQEAIEAAERYVSGQGDLDGAYLEQLRADPRQFLTGRDKERAYLAMLLDFAGLRDEAVWVLRAIPGPGPAGADPVLRNVEGMLAAAHGEYERAKHMLEEALAAAPDNPSLRTAILANLAAVSFQTGRVDDAKAWADHENSAAADISPAAATLIASVQAAVASTDNDRRRLDAAAARLEDASRWRASDTRNQDVAALALITEMAITDSQLAISEGSVSRLARAANVLEVAALRLAAELGAGHPQALAASAGLAQAEVGIALAHASPVELEQAVAQLAGVCQRASSVLGANSLLASQLEKSLDSAKLALSRAWIQLDQPLAATATPPRISRNVSGQAARSAGSGETAATATAVLQKADLGTLTSLGIGGFGEVFRVDESRLPGDMTPLAYMEFATDHGVRAHMAEAAVSFRAGLSPADRAELDRYTAWPKALVADPAGEVCGLLMPLVQQDYLCEVPDSRTGSITSRPCELQWLTAPESARVAARVNLPEISQQDRIALLAQLTYIIAWLHRRGWVYGDLSLRSAVFALNPPRLLLLDCDGAAALSDPNRRQGSSPSWEPPELRIAGLEEGPHRLLQDGSTDVYKLGLAILRCLTPGRGASTTRDASRLGHVLDDQGISLVADALSVDPASRPAARDLYLYLSGLVPADKRQLDFESPREIVVDLASAGAREDSVGIKADEGIQNPQVGQIVMPFYLICDVSFSMYHDMPALNEGIRQLRLAVAAEPAVDDVVQACIMTFSDAAKVIVPMGHLSEIEVPQLTAENTTNYGTAFRALARTLEQDNTRFLRYGYRIYRPCAFFLTDGLPTDHDWRETFTRTLTHDQLTRRGIVEQPLFIPFGFRDASEEILRRLAYPPGRAKWYHSKSTSIEYSLSAFLDVILTTVIASVRSIQAGRRPAIIQPPPLSGSVLDHGMSEQDPD